MLYDYSRVYTEMSQTVEFIRELLSVSPDHNLVEETSEDHEKLDLADSLDDLDFQTVEDTGISFTAAAVDGGQGTVVRNSVFTAGVYRAGYVQFRDRERIDEYSTPMSMVNLTKSNYSGIYKDLYHEFYDAYPESYPMFSETLGKLRGIVEEKCIKLALDKLRTGDILLLDGSLRVSPDDNSGFLDGFLIESKKRGIDVAAVTKASSLLWKGGANAVAVIKNEGDRIQKNKSWYTRITKSYDPDSKKWLGRIYIARLNGFSDLAVRVDLSKYNVSTPAEVFTKLSALSNDPFFLGYPYPLAAVHQMVRLSEDQLLGFSLRLKDLAMQTGIDENGWEMLFSDYHNVLNHDLKERKLHL